MKIVAAPSCISLVALALSLGGCGPAPLQPYDGNTKYRVENTSSGFKLTVNYLRRHFIPAPEAVEEACKNVFVTVAQDVAAKRGRRVQRIDEQQIATQLESDGQNKVSHCTATGPVAWQ